MKFVQSLQNQLDAAQQPAPQAGSMLFSPDSDMGAYAVASGAPQQAAPQGGGMNVMGLNVSPQQAATAKIWLAQGDTEKAIQALTNGDPNMTDTLRNYMVAKQQGYQGSLLDYQKELRTQNNQTMVMPPGESQLQKELGGVIGKDVLGKAIEQGPRAGQLRGQIQMYNDVMQGIRTGQLAALKAGPAGKWLSDLGINIDNMDELQAGKAITRGIAQSMYIPGKGAQSNFEFQALLDQAPQLSNTPGANEMINRTLDSIAASQQQAAAIAMEVHAGTKSATQAMKEISELDPLAEWREFKKQHKLTPTSGSNAPKSGRGVWTSGRGVKWQ